jgi:GDPmannose 4,6-dehydratase
MKALICGVTGQDGAYLAALLLSKGYKVWGTSRDCFTSSCVNLHKLKVFENVSLVSMAPNDFRSVLTAVEISDPDEIYYLAGQSSVGLSFEQPAETLESISTGILNLLEVVRFRKKKVKIYNAGSSECFGETTATGADEHTPFIPRSPYAVAKASAHWLIANYREAYGLYACTGILFNHESPLRPKRFVTQKIIHSAKSIAEGKSDKLVLGRLDIYRDWGWAPEYVDAMWRILQQDTPEDFVISTGVATTLEDFVNKTFSFYDLDWRDYVQINAAFFRPTDIGFSLGNSSKAKDKLNWKVETLFDDIVKNMIINSD